MTKAECIAYVESHMEVKIATANGAYTCGRTINPDGSVNHSVGCAQPSVDVFYNNMNKSSAGWGVNALIGDFHKGEGRILIVLTLDKGSKICSRNWGVGSGSKGSWNNSRIQWEICEPSGHTYAGGTMIGYDVEKNQEYFDRMWKLVVAWNVYIADVFGFAPDMIADHYESYYAGMGSGHADVHHWWPKHGKSMDALRAEVKAILNGVSEKEEIDMTKEEVQALVANAVSEALKSQYYSTLQDIPGCYQASVRKLMEIGCMIGYNGGADNDISTIEDNTILLDETACRIITILDRMGVLDTYAATKSS